MKPLFTLVTCFLASLLGWSQPKALSQAVQSHPFEENKGQLSYDNGTEAKEVRFHCETPSYKVFFRPRGIIILLSSITESRPAYDTLALLPGQAYGENVPMQYKLQQHRVDMRFKGANDSVIINGRRPSAASANYYLMPDREPALGVRRFEEIIYKELYKGIDLRFYMLDGTLKYDFIVHPGADLGQIELDYLGADSVACHNRQQIELFTKLGSILEPKPVSFQKGQSIGTKYKQNTNGSIGFTLGGYSKADTLVIDPNILALNLISPLQENRIRQKDLAVASDGSYYALSSVDATEAIPEAIGFQEHWTGSHWVTLISCYGQDNELSWQTFYGNAGPSDWEIVTEGNGISLHEEGTGDLSIVIAGSTNAELPDAEGDKLYEEPNTGDPGSTDAFVAVFTTSGSLEWARYYGGHGNDKATAVSLDDQGDIYICGTSRSNALPLNLGYYRDRIYSGYEMGFMAKLANRNTVWSLFVNAGAKESELNDIVVTDGFVAAVGAINMNQSTRFLNKDRPWHWLISAFTTNGDFINQLTGAEQDHQDAYASTYRSICYNEVLNSFCIAGYIIDDSSDPDLFGDEGDRRLLFSVLGNRGDLQHYTHGQMSRSVDAFDMAVGHRGEVYVAGRVGESAYFPNNPHYQRQPFRYSVPPVDPNYAGVEAFISLFNVEEGVHMRYAEQLLVADGQLVTVDATPDGNLLLSGHSPLLRVNDFLGEPVEANNPQRTGWIFKMDQIECMMGERPLLHVSNQIACKKEERPIITVTNDIFDRYEWVSQAIQGGLEESPTGTSILAERTDLYVALGYDEANCVYASDAKYVYVMEEGLRPGAISSNMGATICLNEVDRLELELDAFSGFVQWQLKREGESDYSDIPGAVNLVPYRPGGLIDEDIRYSFRARVFCNDASTYSGPFSIRAYACGGTYLGQDERRDEGLGIYPNPVAGQWLNLEAQADYQLFSLQGRLLGTYPNTQRIDVSHLSSGSYLLRSSQGGSQLFQRR